MALALEWGTGKGAHGPAAGLRAELALLLQRLAATQAALRALDGAAPPRPADGPGELEAAAALRQLLTAVADGPRCVVCGAQNSRHELWGASIIPRGYLTALPIHYRMRCDLTLQACTACRRTLAAACDAERRRLERHHGAIAGTAGGAAPGQGPRVGVRGAAQLLLLRRQAPPDVLELAELKHAADAERLRIGDEAAHERYRGARKALARRLMSEPGGRPGGELTKAMGLSASSRAELHAAVAKYLGKPLDAELSDAELEAAAADTSADTLEAGGHAVRVMRNVLQQPGGLAQFARRWRQVFVEAVRPRALPEGWDPDPDPATEPQWGDGAYSPPPGGDWVEWFDPSSHAAPAPGLRKLVIRSDSGAPAPVIDVAAELARLSPEQAERALARAEAAGVTGVVALSTGIADSDSAPKIIAAGTAAGVRVWATAGLHPLRAAEWKGEETAAALRKALQRTGIVACGECGLDYSAGEQGPPREQQLACFRAQVEIAVALGRPLILHERDADDAPSGRPHCSDDLLQVLREAGASPRRCVLHCFTGNTEALARYAKLGFVVGVTGLVARIGPRSAALRAALASGVLPLSQLVVETDSPHMRPDTAYLPADCDLLPRGRNEPALTPAVVRAAAECLGLHPAEVAQQAALNTARVLGLGEDAAAPPLVFFSDSRNNSPLREPAAEQPAPPPSLYLRPQGERLLARRQGVCESYVAVRGCRRGTQCPRVHVGDWESMREWTAAVKCRAGNGCADVHRAKRQGDGNATGCPFVHLGEPLRIVCVHAVAGRCRRGAACWYPHPPPEAARVLAPLFTAEPCNIGDSCPRLLCMRGHGPEQLAQRQGAASAAPSAAVAAEQAEAEDGGADEAHTGAIDTGAEEALRAELDEALRAPSPGAAERWGGELCRSALSRLDDAESYRQRAAAVQQLQAMVRRLAFPRARLLLFGSSATSLAERGADADVAIVCSPERAVSAPVNEVGAVDGLYAALAREPFRRLRRVVRARVPIVSNLANHREEGEEESDGDGAEGDDGARMVRRLQFDITFRTVGVRNSYLLRHYLLEAGPAARAAAAGARAWATNAGIVDVRVGLTRYAVLVLFAHFLVATGEVKWRDPESIKVPFADSAEAYIAGHVPAPDETAELRRRCGDLLGKWWQYYATFDWAHYMPTLRSDPGTSSPVPRPDPVPAPCTGAAPPYRIVVIEDPYEDDGAGGVLNLGRKLNPARAAALRRVFLAAARDFAAGAGDPAACFARPAAAPAHGAHPHGEAAGDAAPPSAEAAQLRHEVAELLPRCDRVLRRLRELRPPEDSGQRRIDGLQRLIRKLETERVFLEAMLSGGQEPTVARVRSSNLPTFEGIAQVLAAEEGIVAVGRSYSTQPVGGVAVEVDVVAARGRRWVKVRGIDPTNAAMVADGTARWGGRPCSALAKDMTAAAAAHPLAWGDIPECIIAFVCPVPQDILASVEREGAQAVLLSRAGIAPQLRAAPADPAETAPVMLDVTALCALCSDLTNGGAVRFPGHSVLDAQALDEQQTAAGPALRRWLEGRDLIVCERVRTDFEAILATVGGDGERVRWRQLRERVTFVPDTPSPRVAALAKSRKVKERQCVVFGTADALRAVTVTANDKFVTAAAEQGVTVAAHLIPARALTEQKRVEQEAAARPAV
eukprot:TRINITY_DN2296_c0_g1_i1.p1 TRINITY_DN2296_c0_g1~~TRINITY_DN2296_c0_g1_i1.p1  ORF type:complete len:1690 (+),score=442.83 TRINITY_DN2296_c0_g1_i1:110-5071(+)